ncbi:hypothetical protein IW139_002819, partial [Coemansia sp. RSA 353]
MSRAGNDKEDVVISEAEGHAANPGVPEESMDEPTHTALLEDEDKPMCTGLLKDEDIHEDEASYAQSKDEDTHEDKAESSAATVSNMSEDLFDMCLDTLGMTAAICVPPVGTGAAIRDAPVGTTAICDVPIGTTSAIHNAPVSTTTAAHHSLPVVTHTMTLAPKRPCPVKKANINYNCTRLGIKDAQTWGAVCDLACHTGSTMFVDIVKQDKAVEDMMD